MKGNIAIVFDANVIMSLNIFRSLGAHSVNVASLYSDRFAEEPFHKITSSSKFSGVKYHIDADNYEPSLLENINKVASSCENYAVLLPTSDKDMNIISINRDLLQSNTKFLFPDHSIIEMLLNKHLFYPHFEKLSIPVPRTFSNASGSNINEISNLIQYPCIIKPAWRNQQWIRRNKSVKAYYFAGKKELLEAFPTFKSNFDEIVIQEYISGSEENIVCYISLVDENSDPMFDFTCRKLRQYPVTFGDTSMAVSTHDEEIIEISRDIIKKIKFKGLIGIEYKYDPQAQTYKVIEITPCRFDRQASILNRSNIDLPIIYYNYLCYDMKRAQIPSYKLGVKWFSEINEARSFPKYILKHKYGIGRFLKSYKGPKTFEIFSRRDIKPFIQLIFSTTVRKVKRALKI